MITPYRRHTTTCLHGSDGMTGLLHRGPSLTPEQIKSWRYCKCPVWREGSYMNIPYQRVSIRVNSWAAAEREIARLLRRSDEAMLRPENTPIQKSLHLCLEAFQT